MAAPSISCFFPCYNDRGTIAGMVLGALFALESITGDFEVIVVDDGSTDGSRELLAKMRGMFPERLRLVLHESNQGYGGALISGFASATKDWVFYTDGDAQYDPAQIVRLAAEIAADVDLVQGFKTRRNDPYHRRILGAVYQQVIRLMFGLRVRDVDCDFRLIRRELVERVHLTRRSGAICAELMRKTQDAGARVREVGVDHHFRVYGRSQIFNWRRLAASVAQLADLWIELVARPAFRPAVGGGGALAGSKAKEADDG